MTRRLLAAALALLCAAAPVAQTDTLHTFEVRDGVVWLDGQMLPDAVPKGLDLRGLSTPPLEYSGPIQPVLEVDGMAYVFEDGRLVPMASSSRPDRGVYILGDAEAEAAAELPRDQMMPLVEAAYMQDVADRNEGLYDRMRQEVAMEQEVLALAERIRATTPGPVHTALRGQLRTLLSDLLSLKHDIRAEEIAVAADRLESAREGLEARRAAHDEIVDGRLRELIGNQ